jgi:aspartate/methionine/tyrosine aminotransferase
VRGSVSNNSQAAQNLLLKAMKDPRYEGEKRDKFAVMKARFQKAREVLSNPKYGDVWKPYPFNSGYFLCVRLNGLNAEEYRLRLLDRYGIGVIATSPTDIRVAFSCLEVNEIEACFEGMRECAASLKDDARARDMGLHGEAFEE